MNDIAHNLAQVRDKISAAATRCGRSPEEITLLAVSKTKPASAIAEAIDAGQRQFGENYVQEGVDKIRHFQELGVTGLEWHFIGPLQSNKSRLVAEHFDWCHTIDRLRIATRLNDQRPAELPPLNVLIQIQFCQLNPGLTVFIKLILVMKTVSPGFNWQNWTSWQRRSLNYRVYVCAG